LGRPSEPLPMNAPITYWRKLLGGPPQPLEPLSP
jgi:hypothetical protein